MRRATNTINYGTALPLAQGVKFAVEGPGADHATGAQIRV